MKRSSITSPPPPTKPKASGRPSQLVAKANRWRDSYNPLRALTLTRVVSLLEAGERGEMAELQWAYRSIEKRNAVCRALILRRASALLKLDWDVKVTEELPAGVTDAMAEAQRNTLRSWYDRIDNLREAIRALALAEFRGYAHLQIQSEDGTAAGIEAVGTGRICLKPLHQWHWVRDGSDGQWGWNEAASVVSWAGISPDNRVEDPKAWGLIIREAPMPVDELALIGFVRKSMSQKDWDAFVEIYGIPGGVVIMPPGVPDGKEAEYEDSAVKVAEGGSGALPNGSTYEPNDAPGGNNPFRDHIQYQDSELVLAGTGGKLTMLTESGSGTLAGGAHQDAFDEIAEGEANEISEVMQRQFDRRVLDLVHPGEPHVAYWELAAEPTDDTDKLVERVVKLKSAGYRASAEEVSERTGLDLEESVPSIPAAASGPGRPPRAGHAQEPDEDEEIEDPPMSNADRPAALVRSGVQQLATSMRADLAPFTRRLEAIEQISDPEIRRARLEALVAEWDSLESDVMADPESAQVLARVQASALVNGLTGQRR
jgi:phage gp29-like protein